MENLEGGLLALEHRYEVGALVRRVGHEHVYEGRRDPFQKQVWIHVFELDAPPDVQLAITERLHDAAHRISPVDEPGLLHALDYGELDEGLPFVITERTQGPSLREVLAREGTLSARRCALLIERLEPMVSALHERELFHGSITPDWIFLPGEDVERAHLGHFALGLTLEEQRALEIPMLSPGALEAIPPEAFALGPDEPLLPSRALDIYALGALAYTCLVGMHPHFNDPDDSTEGMLSLREAAHPLEEQGVDGALARVVQRAIATNPHERWLDASAFASALGEAAGLYPEEQEPPPLVTPLESQAGLEYVAPAADPMPTDAMPSPDRRSAITGLAVLALILSNLAWAFATLSP